MLQNKQCFNNFIELSGYSIEKIHFVDRRRLFFYERQRLKISYYCAVNGFAKDHDISRSYKLDIDLHIFCPSIGRIAR